MEPPTTTIETPATIEPQTHHWTNTSHNRTTIANTEAKRSQHLIKAKPITDSNLANNQSKQNQH